MAKSRKTTQAEQDKMLETPAGSAVTTEPPLRLDWPESTEVRELNVELTEPQLIEQGRTLVDYLRECEDLVQKKKASADSFKSRIEAVEKKIEEVSLVVKSGKDRREMMCKWLFQTNGFDPAGEPIFHSELKTLVRSDSGEVVEIKPITSEDRQVNLPLGEEESLEINMKAITDAGHELKESPPDCELDSAFVLEGPDGSVTPIYADSLAEAAVEARKHLATPAPAEEPAAENTEEPEA